jgi:hypothetical protein
MTWIAGSCGLVDDEDCLDAMLECILAWRKQATAVQVERSH